MKIKKSTIIFVSILLIINSIFVFIYFKYHIYPNIKENTLNIQKKINNNLQELTSNIKEYDSIKNAIKKYQENHQSSIYIENQNGDIVYNNADIWDSKLNYYISRLITVNDKTYLIKLFEKGKWDNLSVINNFIIFEIIIVLIIILIIYYVTSKKLLKPIEKIQKSIKNYKFGIIPKKIESKSELFVIQHEFVDLVTSLEKEKDNQNRIISSITHDIKTPITSILGYSDILKSTKLDKEKKEKYINIIYQKALLLKEITDEFEDYIIDKNSNIQIKEISLKELKKILEIDYKTDLEEKNIDLVIDFKNIKDKIYVDLARLKRVFSNIISNSVRYIKKDGKIQIIEKKNEDNYEFEIVDNGTGTKEDINKLFNPFFTTDKSRKISGLGLSICKEIIEKHGGEITAYNNNLGGLTIKFTINNKI